LDRQTWRGNRAIVIINHSRFDGQGEEPVNETGKTEYLHREIDKPIEEFKRDSTRHKLLNRRLKNLLFCLTGSATILSSATLTFSPDPKIGLGTG
jgi:hypothetical protein